MGQARTYRLAGLGATNARLAVSTGATVVVALVAGALAAAGVADGEVLATVLFLPVFVVGLYAGRNAGFVTAAAVLVVYLAVRRSDLEAAATASAVVLAVTRGIAYAMAAHLGGSARRLIDDGGAVSAGAARYPQARAAAGSREEQLWTEPAYAAEPDRGAPVLSGVGGRSGDSWPGEPTAPVTMSNAGWPPPAGPPSWGEDSPGAGGPLDDSWEAVQQSWRRQHGLPPEAPDEDDTGGWPPAHAAARDEDDTGDWPPAHAAARDEDDTGRWSVAASPAADAPGWPAPAPGGPGWGAPPPAPDSWSPPGNGRGPASAPWDDLAGDTWPAPSPAGNGRTGADEHGPATGETWAAVFTDPTTGRGPATGENRWGPDSWPPVPAAAPPPASPDGWPRQPGAPGPDSWPPTQAASPDNWRQQPGASSRDSWPPTAAVSPEDTWASLAPPRTGDWPSPPAAESGRSGAADRGWPAAPEPDGGWSPAAGGRPGAPAPSPPWAAGVPDRAPSVGGNGWASAAGRGPAHDDGPAPLPAVDPETGLWTARFLRDRLSAERNRSRRSRHPFSLVLVQVPDAPLATLPYRRQLTLLRELGYQFVAGGVVDHLVHVPDQEQHWFAVILPDTDRSGAQVIERRLRLGIGGYLSSRGLRLDELQSASLTAPDDDPAMAAIWDALIGPEDAEDPAAVVPEY